MQRQFLKTLSALLSFQSLLKNKVLWVLKNGGKKKRSFISFGVSLLTSGYNGNDIKQMLEDAVESNFQRKMVQANILNSMASFCPAFGMIGTLVGLVIMFEKMGSDISAIGKGMALALLTTLYGVLLTQLFFKPASEKVRQREEIYRFRNLLIIRNFNDCR